MFRRWWQKNRAQIIWGLTSVAIALLIYQTRGAAIAELLYPLALKMRGEYQGDYQQLYRDRLIGELESRIAVLELENRQLKQLGKYIEQREEEIVLAPIIGRSPDAWWQVVTIGAGSSRGVRIDSVVTSVGGLVGRAIAVTPHTSRVLLISDPNSQVGAAINRTGYLGLIQGKSTETAVMKFYEKVNDVKVGDLVTTSPLSSIFPADIPIGKVVSVQLTASPAPEATVEFTAPLDFLRWVMVHIDREE